MVLPRLHPPAVTLGLSLPPRLGAVPYGPHFQHPRSALSVTVLWTSSARAATAPAQHPTPPHNYHTMQKIVQSEHSKPRPLLQKFGATRPHIP
jgi:hypothetical protein